MIWFLHGDSPFFSLRKFVPAYQGWGGESLLSTIYRAFPLYLPKATNPPYQTIIYFPSDHARFMQSFDTAEIRHFDFLMRSGRAVLFPVYQGTFERRATSPLGPMGERDETIQAAKDLRRSVDYLETREDIDLSRLGYFGLSGGSRLGVIMLAVEPRIGAATLAEGGFSSARRLPEVDEINFAPHVHTPVLVLNGRYDFLHPEDTDQIPRFQLLGTPATDKRRIVFDTGHAGPMQLYIKETLMWFDRYLGPVNRSRRAVSHP